MNTQIRKFYEADEIGGGYTDWFEIYKSTKKELKENELYVEELKHALNGLIFGHRLNIQFDDIKAEKHYITSLENAKAALRLKKEEPESRMCLGDG